MNGRALLDNSAWARLGHAALADERVDEIAEALDSDELVVCLPFLLEAGYSARDARDHGKLVERLLALPWAAIDSAVERRALEARRQLARHGHHRLAPPDLLIAAIADRHGLGVLHYDRDYDLIAEKTDLTFDSIWLADPGVL